MSATMEIPKPTGAELDLLHTLWPIGRGTARQVHTAMQAARADVTYAAVLRLMQIMHAKGLLVRDPSARSHVYSAARTRELVQTDLLENLVKKAFSGSFSTMIRTVLRSEVCSVEREEIAQILREV